MFHRYIGGIYSEINSPLQYPYLQETTPVPPPTFPVSVPTVGQLKTQTPPLFCAPNPATFNKLPRLVSATSQTLRHLYASLHSHSCHYWFSTPTCLPLLFCSIIYFHHYVIFIKHKSDLFLLFEKCLVGLHPRVLRKKSSLWLRPYPIPGPQLTILKFTDNQ